VGIAIGALLGGGLLATPTTITTTVVQTSTQTVATTVQTTVTQTVATTATQTVTQTVAVTKRPPSLAPSRGGVKNLNSEYFKVL